MVTIIATTAFLIPNNASAAWGWWKIQKSLIYKRTNLNTPSRFYISLHNVYFIQKHLKKAFVILFLWLCINDNLTLRSIFRNPTSTARHQIRDNNQLSKFVAKLEYPIIIIMIQHPACDKTRKSTINWSVFVNNKLEITFYTTAAAIYNSAVSESMYMKLVLHE